MNIPAKVPLSVIVPTKDEERNITACIDSLDWAGEVVVFDSHSTDATVAIAKEKGARIVQREFDSFARHKNWALDNIDLAHEWVLFVDADERATPALGAEIASVVDSRGMCNGYYVAGQNWMWGRPLRCIYPNFNLRLIRRGKGRFEDRVVHEHMVIEGAPGYLTNHLIHRDDKGMERYFDRHNTYTSFEAVEIYRARTGVADTGGLRAAFLRKGPEGRRLLKNFAYRYLPARPLFFFLYLYVIKRGFLDGRAGFRYAAIKMFFDYVTSIKVRELEDEDSPMRAKYRRHIQ